MQMLNAKRATAKRQLGIESATVKSLINACETGVRPIGTKPESNHESGATGNWLTQVPRKKQLSALLKPQRQSATKTGDEMKCLPRMAAIAALVVPRLNGCFCR